MNYPGETIIIGTFIASMSNTFRVLKTFLDHMYTAFIYSIRLVFYQSKKLLENEILVVVFYILYFMFT
jgi:hypothetical protein